MLVTRLIWRRARATNSATVWWRYGVQRPITSRVMQLSAWPRPSPIRAVTRMTHSARLADTPHRQSLLVRARGECLSLAWLRERQNGPLIRRLEAASRPEWSGIAIGIALKDDLARESSRRAFGNFEREKEREGIVRNPPSRASSVCFSSSREKYLDKVYFQLSLCARPSVSIGGIFRHTRSLYEGGGAVLKKTTIESRLKTGRVAGCQVLRSHWKFVRVRQSFFSDS